MCVIHDFRNGYVKRTIYATREVQALMRESTTADARSTAVFRRRLRGRLKAALDPPTVLTYCSASCGPCHVSHICPLRCMHDECKASRTVHFTIALAEEI
jgi:hypothetical protein